MDETACNYNSEATVSGDCTYPDANADCEGNFVCNDLLFTLDMYDLSGDADGWNGNTFQVIDWVTGQVVPGAQYFTLTMVKWVLQLVSLKTWQLVVM